MAENDQERTEQPTQKRRDDARREGRVPRSPELNAAAVVMVGGASLYFIGGHIGAGLDGLMRASLNLTRAQSVDEARMGQALLTSVLVALKSCAPVLGLTLTAALLAPMTLGGWNLSFEALVPNFGRINPLSGIKRMFSVRGAVELCKAFAKFGLVAVVAYLFLRTHTRELLGLGAEPLQAGLRHAVSLCGQAFLFLAGTLALIAGMDVPWQLYRYTSDLKMSREEVRQESRERDGAPEVKKRIRQAQQAAARRRMMHKVKTADVVVTNPTHYAVALRYDEQNMRAPVVVAKGADLIAARIRELADEHRVPIFEAPPLARALHHSVDIGGEIPASLYVAVAQVLTYVYQLRTAQRRGTALPVRPSIDPSIDPTSH